MDKLGDEYEQLEEQCNRLQKQLAELHSTDQGYIQSNFESRVEYDSDVNRRRHVVESKYEIAQSKLLHKRNEFDSMNAQYIAYKSYPFYLAGLPTPFTTAKTDADGKFSLKLKPGKYVLAAISSRTVGTDTEKYCWLVWLTVDPNQSKRVMLSNDNLFETNCSDCLVHLTDFPS